ncbi:MAG: ABC transporter permease [Chloroflexota bacterium]
MSGLRRRLRPLAIPILAVISAFLVGSLFLIFTDIPALQKLFGGNPLQFLSTAVGNVVKAYGALITGALGNPASFADAISQGTPEAWAKALRPISETLVAATPLIFTGLAIAVSFRSGVFNIGGDGQFVLGALGATAMALFLNGVVGIDFAPLILLLSLLSGIVFGMGWGFIPGFLKARTGAHEVITTIMLNYVALQIVQLALRTPFMRPPTGTEPISKVIDFARVPQLIPLPGLRLHWGFVVALLVAALVSYFMFRTTKGFELRSAGQNLTAAKYAGMSAGGSIILAMVVSGALAGLGGAFQVMGTVTQMSNDVNQGYGWTAIALALLGGTRPGGVVAAAILFGALNNGGHQMQIETSIPLDLLVFIQALVIMFVAAPDLVRAIYRLKAKSAEPGAPAEEGAAA